MKFAITGKGGTGKSTIASILAHRFNDHGFRVLAVDADPDANLASALGVPREQAASIVPISEQSRLIQERTGAKPRQFGQLFKMNPTVKDIPDEYSLDIQGIKLLVMGAVRKGGSGCACPENVLLQSLLAEIILNRDEVVIVDMEAGIEHLGRATIRAIDQMLIIVEPCLWSLDTARMIIKLAADIELHSFGIIGNKIQNPEQADWIREQLPSEPVMGMVSYSEKIQKAALEQSPITDSLDKKLKTELDRIYKALSSQL